ncbi:MAG: pyridoxal-phosphate dependent enzyme [Chitinophagaceae bacterium]|nr:pyridoxal-phosphate dependent enzyme [Chitinophagaceae bacterium]
MELSTDPITLDPLSHFLRNGVLVSVLRLDKIHPVISGNKWFKLKHYLAEAISKNKERLVTFGGAYSNHIIATAAIASMHGLKSTGVIRGDRPECLSLTLESAMSYGMELHFISRVNYARKKLPDTFGGKGDLIIPEGGYGEKGALGASSMQELVTDEFTHYCCAIGTGTMMAGLINSCKKGEKVVGLSVLKNEHSLQSAVSDLLKPNGVTQWQIIDEYHFGGYAKYTQELILFMNELYRQSGIPTDRVYTAKLFYGINDLIGRNYFPAGSRLLIIHSGGLQGNNSLKKGTLIF